MPTQARTKSLYSYQIRSFHSVASCSPFSAQLGFCRDAAAWESFDASSVAPYFSTGIAQLTEKIAELQNMGMPYTLSQATELSFMVDALTHARLLLDAQASSD